jgi:hypothetical protein
MRYFMLMIGLLIFCIGNVDAQKKSEPWRSDQLMAPSLLAEKITSNQTANMLILSIGPDAIIKGSVDIGPTQEDANLEKLKMYLKQVPSGQKVILYCGCCPFDKCPNIRPAFAALNKMGFKNAQLLNIPKNIKVDWIDKDYPTKD